MENDKFFKLLSDRLTLIEATSAAIEATLERRCKELDDRNENHLAELKAIIAGVDAKLESLVRKMADLVQTQHDDIQSSLTEIATRVTINEKDIEIYQNTAKRRMAYIVASIPIVTFLISMILDFVKKLKEGG
ncbi:MAG: hypothetical protein ACYS1A_08315 [Planctomycetota bacterium]|jgi:CHASE3 domain sensor protein